MVRQKAKWLPDESAEKLRKRRETMHLTLEEMANRTGYSVSHLSNIEKGKRGLSRDVFDKIVDAYQIYNYASYISPERYRKASVIVLKEGDDRESIKWEDTICRVAQNVELEAMAMFPGDVTIPPGGKTSVKEHIIEEFAFVLEGQVDFYIDGKKYSIKQNESIHFKSDQAHAVKNPTEQPARVLIIRCP